MIKEAIGEIKMDNVIVRSIGKETKVEIKPFKMLITFDEEHLAIEFEGAKQNLISLKGNTQFLFDGDTHFISTGELGFITKNENIYLDSIDGKIYFNSRKSKLIKNLPESIEKRKLYDQEKEKSKLALKQIHFHKEIAEKEFNIHMEDIETRLSNLEKANAKCI